MGGLGIWVWRSLFSWVSLWRWFGASEESDSRVESSEWILIRSSFLLLMVRSGELV